MGRKLESNLCEVTTGKFQTKVLKPSVTVPIYRERHLVHVMFIELYTLDILYNVVGAINLNCTSS